MHVYHCVNVCVCRVITALESMLSGVGGVTRLDFWTLFCMDQMVHYTPVWQSNCSLYAAYKHTCTYAHAEAHTHTCTEWNVFRLTVSVRTERSCSGGLDSHDTHICQIDSTSPRWKKCTFLFFICPCSIAHIFLCQHIMLKKEISIVFNFLVLFFFFFYPVGDYLWGTG